FAGYNVWCNERLYEAAAQIPDAEYRADRGAFFKSLHGTLNHLLVGDRIWMRRFIAQGAVPPGLDAILYDDFMQLRAGTCIAERHHRQRAHAEFRSDHLSARNRSRPIAQDRLRHSQGLLRAAPSAKRRGPCL